MSGHVSQNQAQKIAMDLEDVPFAIARRVIYAILRELTTLLASRFCPITSNLEWNQ